MTSINKNEPSFLLVHVSCCMHASGFIVRLLSLVFVRLSLVFVRLSLVFVRAPLACLCAPFAVFVRLSRVFVRYSDTCIVLVELVSDLRCLLLLFILTVIHDR